MLVNHLTFTKFYRQTKGTNFAGVTSLVFLNCIFFKFFCTNSLILAADDSGLILTKVASYTRNPLNMNVNPYISTSDQLTLSVLSEWLFGLISSVFALDITMTQKLILFMTVNGLFLTLRNIVMRYSRLPNIITLLTILSICLSYSPIWLRPISPGFNLVILLIALNVLLNSKCLREPKMGQVITLVLLNLYLSLAYVFYSLILTVTIAFCQLFLLLKGKKLNFSHYFFLLLNFIPGFFFFILSHQSNQSYQDLSFRWGVIQSHFPGSLRTFLFSSLGIIAALLYLKNDLKYLFLSLFLSSIILSNSQIFTGTSMEFDSHFFPPVFVATTLVIFLSTEHLLFVLFSQNGFGKESVWRGISYSLFIVLLLNLSLVQFRAVSRATTPSGILISFQTQLFPRFDKLVSEEKSATISVDSKFRDFIPLFTRHKLLYSLPGTSFFPMTNWEVIERRVLDDRIQGLNSAYSLSQIREIFPRHFVNFEQKKRLEKQFFSRNVVAEENELALKYDLYVTYANRISNDLITPEGFLLYLKKYGVEASILMSTPSSLVHRYFRCTIVEYYARAVHLCVRL